MGTPLLMNFLDVARCLGREPLRRNAEQVADFIEVNLARSGGNFNYNPAMKALYDVFRGGMTGDEAERICRLEGAPAGRKSNGDAIRIAGAFAESNRSVCHRIPFMAVPIARLSGNRTAYMAIKAPLVRIQQKRTFVVVPGFRMSHRPEKAEIDVAASLALAALARDGYEEADFEYLYAGPSEYGGRILKIYHGSDRTIYDVDMLDYLLDVYARGLQIALERGLGVKAPNFRGYKVYDPDQPRFV